VPLGEHVGDVVAGCQEQASQEVALGHLAARADGNDRLRVSAPHLKVLDVVRLEDDLGARLAGLQGMILEDDVSSHHLD
jgi:hypothetical protein